MSLQPINKRANRKINLSHFVLLIQNIRQNRLSLLIKKASGQT